MKRFRALSIADLIIVVIGVALAILLRLSLLQFKSVDYLLYTKGWYNFIKANGFHAFSQGFANYNLPYLYLLYVEARFFPDMSPLIATKIPSLIADFISAWLAYRIVLIKYSDSILPIFGFFAVLFAPTVVLNSSFWGQADALYTCALLASIYLLILRRTTLSMIFYGASVSIKAQAIFFLPLLIALFLRKEIPWRDLLVIPIAAFLSIVPAWLAGRPLIDLLLIYPSQAGQYEQLSMHGPTLLSLIPNAGLYFAYFYYAGIILAVLSGFLFVLMVFKGQIKMTPAHIVELALISLIIIPFFLPEIHERYFYPADILSIIFAFFFSAYFYIPILMSAISFFAYQPTLFGVEPLSINWLAFGILLIIVLLIKDIISSITPENPQTETP